MKFARVIDTQIIEIIDFNPQGRYTPEVEAQFIECPEGIDSSWIYENGEFKQIEKSINPIIPLDKTPFDLLEERVARLEQIVGGQ
jgi:hypothetical protein